MAVRVDIFNSAAGHAGSGTVLASAEEDGAVARELRRHYPQARDTLFAEFPWTWARRVTTATAVAVPPAGFTYAYPVPDGCAEVRKVTQTAEDTAEPIDFRLGGDTDSNGIDRSLILTQQPALYITWTRIVVNEALWPPPFANAVSWRLAALAGSAINRDGFRRQECWQQAAYWFGIAQAQDQRQGRMAPRDAEIIRGRA